jgi:hypothetical protein
VSKKGVYMRNILMKSLVLLALVMNVAMAQHELDNASTTGFLAKFDESSKEVTFAKLDMETINELGGLDYLQNDITLVELNQIMVKNAVTDITVVDLENADEADLESASGNFYYTYYNPWLVNNWGWNTWGWNTNIWYNNWNFGFQGFRNFNWGWNTWRFGFFW